MASRASILRFIGRTAFAALPLLLLPIAYALWDPFWVLRDHGDDALGTPGDTARLSRNAGWVAMKNLEQYGDSVRPDSFIFGSSMSQNFHARDWAQYLPANASVYHMDQSMETLEGIADKVEWLAEQGYQVKNALIIIEEAMLHRDPQDNDFLFARPPRGTKEEVAFQLTAFQLFKEPEFLMWAATGGYLEGVTEARRTFLTTDLPTRDPSRNESRYTTFDSLIAVNPDAYFTAERLRRIEYNEALTPPQPAIDERRLSELKGSVVLLDFTAYEMKGSQERTLALRELYNKFHPRGLEIYQVSLDRSEHYWKTMSEQLPWVCVWDEEGLDNDLVRLYNLQSLPTWFLISRQSELVGRMEMMDNLEREIEKLL